VYQPQQAAPTVVGNATFVNPVLANMNANGGLVTPVTAPAPNAQAAPPQTCPPLDIPIEEAISIVKQVYTRLYLHIFSKCGFNPAEPTSFSNPGAVYDPVSIADIPNAGKVFLAMDITDTAGVPTQKAPIVNQIQGQVFKKSGLPGYWLWLNCGGVMMKRALVPQNPNKLGNNNQPSTMAVRVRQGWAVMWVIADGVNGAPSEMKVKIETQPGGATTYTDNPFKK
jgi:hypothetical protein